jgi:hypothetical protein
VTSRDQITILVEPTTPYIGHLKVRSVDIMVASGGMNLYCDL